MSNTSGNMKMLVVDYDGTLAASDSYVSEYTTVKFAGLEELKVVRVINTGRSLFSLKNVIDRDFPVDYVVFSAGVGIYDWKRKTLLRANNFTKTETFDIYNYLCKCNYDFMVQLPVPDNHYFHHFGNIRNNVDFRTRINNYESYGIKSISECPEQASQFVVICTKGTDYFNRIKSKFPSLKVVKATSPINHCSVWVEILPSNISKASGIEFLRNRLNINKSDIVAVGNDYYDLDMLHYVDCTNAYVISNAPPDIKPGFNIIDSNDQNAVGKLVDKLYY